MHKFANRESISLVPLLNKENMPRDLACTLLYKQLALNNYLSHSFAHLKCLNLFHYSSSFDWRRDRNSSQLTVILTELIHTSNARLSPVNIFDQLQLCLNIRSAAKDLTQQLLSVISPLASNQSLNRLIFHILHCFTASLPPVM